MKTIDIINSVLLKYNIEPLTLKDIKDWGLKEEGEDIAEVEQYARDYASDCHSENCEAKDAWRYQL